MMSHSCRLQGEGKVKGEQERSETGGKAAVTDQPPSHRYTATTGFSAVPHPYIFSFPWLKSMGWGGTWEQPPYVIRCCLRAAGESLCSEPEDAVETAPSDGGKLGRVCQAANLGGKQHFEKAKKNMSGSRYTETAFTVAFHESWQQSPMLAAQLRHMSHLQWHHKYTGKNLPVPNVSNTNIEG